VSNNVGVLRRERVQKDVSVPRKHIPEEHALALPETRSDKSGTLSCSCSVSRESHFFRMNLLNVDYRIAVQSRAPSPPFVPLRSASATAVAA